MEMRQRSLDIYMGKETPLLCTLQDQVKRRKNSFCRFACAELNGHDETDAK